jgi:hypothetical protein
VTSMSQPSCRLARRPSNSVNFCEGHASCFWWARMHVSKGLWLACCGAAFAMSHPASAQPFPDPSAPPPIEAPPPALAPVAPAPSSSPASAPPGATSWYGYQILLVDAAAIATTLWGSVSEEYGTGYGLAITLFVTGGPVIHALHHHTARALASAALRVGLPVLCMIAGGGIGAASAGPPPPDNYASFPVWLPGAAAGLSLGILGAMIADDAFLAWDEEPAPTELPQSLASRPSFTIAPRLSVARDREHGDRTTVGVGGTF